MFYASKHIQAAYSIAVFRILFANSNLFYQCKPGYLSCDSFILKFSSVICLPMKKISRSCINLAVFLREHRPACDKNRPILTAIYLAGINLFKRELPCYSPLFVQKTGYGKSHIFCASFII